METSVVSMLERLTPPAADAEPNWQDVLKRSQALAAARAAANGHAPVRERWNESVVPLAARRGRPAWQVRFLSALAAAAVAAAIAVTTPVGAAIAHTLGDLSNWVTGHPARLYQKLRATPFPPSLLPAGLQTKGPATLARRMGPYEPAGWDVIWAFSGNPPQVTIDYFIRDDPKAAALDFSIFRKRIQSKAPWGSHFLAAPWRTVYTTLLMEGGMPAGEGHKYCGTNPHSCFEVLSLTRVGNVEIYAVAEFRPHSSPLPTMHKVTSAAIAFLLATERNLAKTK